MSCIAPPAGSLSPQFTKLKAGKVIHQLYDANYPPGCFHPGTGPLGGLARPTRFAPILDASGKNPVPYLYAGASLQCAIFETIFHDVDFTAAGASVDLAKFKDKAHCELTVNRELKLVKLHGTGLPKLKVSRVDLIESLARCYTSTALWAKALYDQHPDVDGLVWKSRRLDDHDSYVLFGGRVTASDLSPVPMSAKLEVGGSLRARVFKEALDIDLLLIP